MTLYNFKFKCRMCGEVYIEGTTGDDTTAFKCVLCASVGRPSGIVMAPHLISVHIKGNNHYGISDFIGCEIESEGNE